MTTFSLLHLSGLPIFEQLQLEEALLRADEGNWCLINSGVPPAIVMGISAKPEELLDLPRVQQDNIPVIKRFSGGGTVYVDGQTLFVTFICNSKELNVPTYPRSILEWTGKIYKPTFPAFEIQENDYVFGEKKFGGNAQYIKKDRWLHHTSFLWDFDAEKMNVLRLPKRRPTYRGERGHEEFLCRLRDYFPSQEHVVEKLKEELRAAFTIEECSIEDALPILSRPHRKGTKLLLDVIS